MNRLSIKNIISSGFVLILLKWKHFLKVSIVPLFFIALAFYFINTPLIELITNELATEHLIWIFAVLYMIISWSINIHRMILLGDDSVGQFGEYVPNRRFGLYLATLILLMVIIFVIGLIAQLLIGISITMVMLFTYMFVFYFVIKMSLKFPAIAVDDENFMKQNLEKSNIAQLFFILVLLPMAVSSLLGYGIESLGDNLLTLILSIFLNIIMFYWTTVNLALCYQTLKQNTQNS